MPKEVKISCKTSDAQLYKILTVIQAYLVAKECNFEIEELRVDSNYVYFVKNNSTGLEGYIGRDINTKNKDIAFMLMDQARILWAEKEGFTRKEAFEKVGVFIHAANMTSFLNWLLLEKEYKLKGSYITAKK